MPKTKKKDYLLIDDLEQFRKLSEKAFVVSHDMLKFITSVDNIAYEDVRTNYKNFEKDSNDLRRILSSYKNGKIRHIYTEHELEAIVEGTWSPRQETFPLKEIYEDYLSNKEKIVVTDGHTTGRLVGIGADFMDTYWLIETEGDEIWWCSCVGAIKPI